MGSGFIAGMTYHLRIEDPADSWYHGGGDMVFVDGATNPACINGIGSGFSRKVPGER